MELRNAVKANYKSNIDYRRKVISKNQWKKEFFSKFISAIRKMKKFGLTFEDVMTSNIVANTSFFSPSSYAFLQYVKRERIDPTLDLLNHHRRLIFEYDNVWQNAYHIAAKRGYVNLLYELLYYKGDIDAYDMTGRTPLMWALECDNLNCIRLLLAAGANPFVTKSDYLKKMVFCGEIIVMLNNAKKLNVIQNLINRHNKNKIFQQVFPFKEIFGVHMFERELKMEGYKFRGRIDRPRLSIR